MKKILIIVFIILMSVPLLAKNSNLYIYQNGKVIGQFTQEQFKTLVYGAEAYQKELEAEDSDRIKIEVTETPYKIESEGVYKTTLIIRWFDKDNTTILKELKVSSKIIIPETSNGIIYPKWRIIYRDVCEYAAPSNAVLLILVVLILSL